MSLPSARILLSHIWSAPFRALLECHLIRKAFLEHPILHSTSLSPQFFILLPHLHSYRQRIANWPTRETRRLGHRRKTRHLGLGSTHSSQVLREWSTDDVSLDPITALGPEFPFVNEDIQAH